VNVWFRDRRFKEAETKSIAADQAERQNQRDLAMALNYEAAEGFASVAISVPAMVQRWPRTTELESTNHQTLKNYGKTGPLHALTRDGTTEV
jgi:hypothetical protein